MYDCTSISLITNRQPVSNKEAPGSEPESNLRINNSPIHVDFIHYINVISEPLVNIQ